MRPSIQSEMDSRSGSALIIVLAVAVVLAMMVSEFSAQLNRELKAAGGNYEEAVNVQLARSALALARLELNAAGSRLYANGYGDAYLVSGTEDYESAIEELQVYRDGYGIGRGLCSYRLVYSPAALDPNELGQNAWHRLLEVACGVEEGTERSELVDRINDWIDRDNMARANGMEEDDYQALDTPRHVKNAPFASAEELMLVYGITPELFYGRRPPWIEDGMLWGGGLQRFLIGDNSPEGRASAQYIRQAVYPSDEQQDELEEAEYRLLNTLPEPLYLIAQGYAAEPVEEDTGLFYDDRPEEPVYLSRRILVVRLVPANNREAGYRIDDMLENAPRELVDRLLAYGVAETD